MGLTKIHENFPDISLWRPKIEEFCRKINKRKALKCIKPWNSCIHLLLLIEIVSQKNFTLNKCALSGVWSGLYTFCLFVYNKMCNPAMTPGNVCGCSELQKVVFKSFWFL